MLSNTINQENQYIPNPKKSSTYKTPTVSTYYSISSNNPTYTNNDEYTNNDVYTNIANKSSKKSSPTNIIKLPSSLDNSQVVGEVLRQAGKIATQIEPAIVGGFKFVMPNGGSFLAADLVKASNATKTEGHTIFTLTETPKGDFHVITVDQLSSVGYGKPLYVAKQLGKMKPFQAAANSKFINERAKGLSNQINNSANGKIISFANVRENTDAQLSINTGFLVALTPRSKKPSPKQVNKLVDDVLAIKMAGVNKAIRNASTVDDAITVLAVALSAGTGTPLAIAKKIAKEEIINKEIKEQVINAIKPSLNKIIKEQLSTNAIKAIPVVGVAWKIDIAPVSNAQQKYIKDLTNADNFGDAGKGAIIIGKLAKEAANKQVDNMAKNAKEIKKVIDNVGTTFDRIGKTADDAKKAVEAVEQFYQDLTGNNPRPQY